MMGTKLVGPLSRPNREGSNSGARASTTLSPASKSVRVLSKSKSTSVLEGPVGLEGLCEEGWGRMQVVAEGERWEEGEEEGRGGGEEEGRRGGGGMMEGLGKSSAPLPLLVTELIILVVVV